MKPTPIHTWELVTTTMSRRGRRRRNQKQLQDQLEGPPREWQPRRGSHQTGNYGQIANGGPRLGSYQVTHSNPNPDRQQPIPPLVHNPTSPQYERPYERPSHSDLRRLKKHLLVCLEQLEEWLSETENGDRMQIREARMDWRPETELLIPQIEGGMQMTWAWGHERPALRVSGEMGHWNTYGGGVGSGKRRAEEMGDEVEDGNEGIR